MKTQKYIYQLVFIITTSLLSGTVYAGGEEETSTQTWNVTTNPFSYFMGRFNVGVSRGLTDRIAISASPAIVHIFQSDPKISGASLNVGLPVYFDQLYKGIYLEPGISATYLTQKSLDGGRNSGILAGPQALVGHVWSWPSGFNIDLGLGLGYNFGKLDLVGTGSTFFSGTTVAGKLQFGYAF